MKLIHGDPNKGRQPTLFASGNAAATTAISGWCDLEVELGVTRARFNQAKKEEDKWKKKYCFY